VIHTDVVSHHGFGDLDHDWTALARSLHATPFLEPGWLRAWWRAFGDGVPAVFTARRNGRLVGVVPLRANKRTLMSASNWHSASSGLLALDEEAASALADALVAERAATVRISFLDATRPGASALVEAAKRKRKLSHSRIVERPPYAVLDGTWEEYFAARSKNLRADVGRRLRRLEEAGELKLELCDGSERLAALLEEGFAVEAAGWKGEQGTAISSDQTTRRFYREVAEWAAARGILQLVFLRLDGVAVAFHLNLVSDSVHYHLKGGFDPAYERFSPGKVLHRLLLERAFAERINRYEFLGADEGYKLQWATGERELTEVCTYRLGPRGLVRYGADVAGRPIARRALLLRARLKR
jgi:CelD/BcsL family acetyltransferase involved in cellulose biosynthesis